MQDSKDTSRARSLASNSEGEGSAINGDAATGPHPADQSDADGWQQYRRWISKAPAPHGRRVGVDASLYTWKGYRNWTEQIKRNWSDS